MASEITFWSKRAALSAAIAFAGWYMDALHGLGLPQMRAAIGATAQISATMLGFVLAALAVLATIANTKLVRNMQRTGHYKLLMQRMYGCIIAFGVVTITGLILLFAPRIHSDILYAFAFVVMVSALLLYDVTRKLWTVLGRLHPD